MQSVSQVWTRIPLLLIVGLGMGCALLMLGWIALNLFRAAVTSVVMLLLTPLALLAVGFGEAGRSAALGTAGAVLRNLLALAYFSAILGADTYVEHFIAGDLGVGKHAVAWLVVLGASQAGLFLQREEIAGPFSFGLYRRSNTNPMRVMQALGSAYLGARLLGMGVRGAASVTGVRPAFRALRTRRQAGQEAWTDTVRERNAANERQVAAEQARADREREYADAEPAAAQAEQDRTRLDQANGFLLDRRTRRGAVTERLREARQREGRAEQRKTRAQEQLEGVNERLSGARERLEQRRAASEKATERNIDAETPAGQERTMKEVVDAERLVGLAETEVAGLEAQARTLQTRYDTADLDQRQAQVDGRTAEQDITTFDGQIARLEREKASLERELGRASVHNAEKTVASTRIGGFEPTAAEVSERVQQQQDRDLLAPGGARRRNRQQARDRRRDINLDRSRRKVR